MRKSSGARASAQQLKRSSAHRPLCKCSECECAAVIHSLDVRFFDPLTANANQIAFANPPSEIWCTRVSKPLFQLHDAPLLCKKADTQTAAAIAARRRDTKEKCKHTAECDNLLRLCAFSPARVGSWKKCAPASVKHSEQVKVNHLDVFQ